MNKEKGNDPTSDFFLEPGASSAIASGKKRMKRRKGFVDLKVLVLVVVLAIIIVLFFV